MEYTGNVVVVKSSKHRRFKDRDKLDEERPTVIRHVYVYV